MRNVAERLIVYQVMNFDREEMFFGTTDVDLLVEIERVAKNMSGPAREWRKGEVVSWRPLTDLIEASTARILHRDFEKGTPPNKFTVISTFKPEG